MQEVLHTLIIIAAVFQGIGIFMKILYIAVNTHTTVGRYSMQSILFSVFIFVTLILSATLLF